MTQDIRHYMNILNEENVLLFNRPDADLRTNDEKYDDAVTQQVDTRTQQSNIRDVKKQLDVIRFYLDQTEYSSTETLITDFRKDWYAGFSLHPDEANSQYKLLIDTPEFIDLAMEFNRKYGFDMLRDMIYVSARKESLHYDN